MAVFLLVCGCLIYLLFRSKTLNLYQWCLALGMASPIEYARGLVHGWVVPDFIKFSLPDGLYCAAYILLIDSIWSNDKRILKYFVLSIVPIVTIASEILQYFGYVKGTFDILDFFCYMCPPLLYIINNTPTLLFDKQKNYKL